MTEELKPMEWISVEDRLPEEGEVVFVYCHGNRIDFCPYIGEWPLIIVNWEERRARVAVTHWMPLPEPPTDKSP